MATCRIVVLGLLVLAAAAASPAPTGGSIGGCGLGPISDSNLDQLDRVQSAGAAKICALYLNTHGGS
jgi:hypothetical protein